MTRSCRLDTLGMLLLLALLLPSQTAPAVAGNAEAKAALEEGWKLYLAFNPEDTAAAIERLKQAVALEPDNGRALAALALAYHRYGYYHWNRRVNWEKHSGVDMFSNDVLFDKVLAVADKHPTVLSNLAHVTDDLFSGNAPDALKNAEQAIAADGTDPASHLAMAWALLIDGKPRDAIAALDKASALSPDVPSEYDYLRGVSLLVANDFETAAAVLHKAADRNPPATMLFVPLSAALVRLDRREEARQSLQRYYPDTDQAGLEAIVGNMNDALFPFEMTPKLDFFRERLYDAVRVAALPLDVTPETLEADLRGDDRFARKLAIRRLGWFGRRSAASVPALVKLLDDDFVRADAIETLGKIGSEAAAARPELEALAGETLVKLYVEDALKRIDGR